MPLYDYRCDDCGRFTDRRPMSEAAAPADCPTCRTPARRIISAPFVANMNPHTRIAHQRNEKSADEPQFVQKKISHDADAHPHRHGHGCGHAHKHSHGHGRPWMIGH